MDEVTAADEKEHLGHFYDSPRHRMQVDFTMYVADLRKEIAAGRSGPHGQAVRAANRGRLSRPGQRMSPVVVTGVDPVTFRFSGGRSAN